MNAHRIPNALIAKSTEFFTLAINDVAQPMCIHAGVTYDFDHMPASKRLLVLRSMKSQPVIENAMQQLINSTDDHAKLKRFIMCRYGALNNEPDIDSNNILSEPEYVPCELRGSCKFEGIGCCAIKVSETSFLSRAETEVFKLVRLPDKLIADTLFLSVETVKKHFQNIRFKTGFNNKIEMAIWATQKGII